MMRARCWLNEPDLPEGHEYEVYHATSTDWRNTLFHSHNSYEFYFFIRGDVRISIENQMFRPEYGDMFIYPPGVAHGNIPIDAAQQYERAYFYFTPQCVASMSSPACDLQAMLDQAAAEKRYHYHLGENVLFGLLAQMDQIINDADNSDAIAQHINRCRLNILVASCCRIVSDKQYQPTRIAPSRISQVLDYINDHLCEPLSTEMLADMFFINKYHLMHAFRDYTNTSVHQYIMARRIVYAQQLLQRGISAQDIGRQCGFGDYAGFYRAFRTRVGMSPQEYAKRIGVA